MIVKTSVACKNTNWNGAALEAALETPHVNDWKGLGDETGSGNPDLEARWQGQSGVQMMASNKPIR